MNLFVFILFIFSLLLIFLFTFYTINLLKKIESKNIENYAKTQELLFEDNFNKDKTRSLLLKIIDENQTIPIVILNEFNQPIIWENYNDNIFEETDLAKEKIAYLKKNFKPIRIKISGNNHFIYFENSVFYKSLTYLPYVLITIYVFFFYYIRYRFLKVEKIIKNSLWVGFAKETAHQLGTPLSSVSGWVELLKIEANDFQKKYINEIEVDVKRLNKIANRFSKIGAQQNLKRENLITIIQSIESYYQKRISSNISFNIINDSDEVFVYLNKDLFSWVIENLLNNSLDAIKNKIGEITIKIISNDKKVKIFFIDNGSGIENKKKSMIFEPGFTTKKRGWGIGLSLSKRIIEEDHLGKIYLLESTPCVKTIFVIELVNSK